MLNRLLPALLLALFWLTNSASAVGALLAPERAFQFSARALDAHTLEARWQIADEYYMYRDRFRFEVEPAEAKLGTPQLPPGKFTDDDNFGRVEIYRGEVAIRLPLEVSGNLSAVTLKVRSQGCADMGVCYPPLAQQAVVQLSGAGATTAPVEGSSSAGKPSLNPLDWFAREQPQMSVAPDANLATSPATGAGAGAASAPASIERADESSRIARLLKDASLGAALLFFFGSGLALSFTPCMFPMIPILSGIIVGHGHHIGRGRAFSLSLAYVLGMALVYAIVGVAAGLSGTLISAALQNAWFLGAGALIFVVLALAMFGLYELQMPSFLQGRFRDEANRQPRGSLHGVFWMGAISAAIVGPCVAAPLAGALLYIAHTGDATLGGLALFAMGIGMGLPLLLIGASTRHLLPRPGPWMNAVNRFFGVLLLAVALWLISPLIPVVVQMLGWAALLILPAIYLHALDPLPADAHGWQRFGKGLGVISLLMGAALLIGALGGSRDPLQPLEFLRSASASAQARGTFGAPAGELRFERIRTLAELEARLENLDRPVLLDFYADWCISCKQMERQTFAEPSVAALMNRMLLLRVDVTADSADDRALLQRFELFGPPGIIFFDAQGKELADLRTIGFVAPAGFRQTLEQAL
ncbi:Thiol:disulfide interchange protein DsbD [Sterolibacterium denitrificans]|uniref:Thiol:disulfide interchange protein DsbD n=1 Tax=Sterolibacterium denitrificans TaxID=157592 RepID=A0A7Z7HQR8_9PROT|nr:protein-disulfide reductase DsbD [Sterolibacterium denitrificans]SMB23850.1 Thiol:disulfide interchange protein DsbD [Sterolibacterium denitrificans]